MIPDLIRRVGTVEQEGATCLEMAEDVEALQESERMDSQKFGLIDQVGAADRVGAEAQVRNS